MNANNIGLVVQADFHSNRVHIKCGPNVSKQMFHKFVPYTKTKQVSGYFFHLNVKKST